LARQNSVSWVAIGVIDHREHVSGSTISHFHANPSVLIPPTIIELETDETDASILEIPARKPETIIKVPSQLSNRLPKRPYRYRITPI
jgi:hypothetical protein